MTQKKESENPELQSPLWHKAVLEARLKEYERGEAKTFTLEELKERLLKK
jgi:hypothetical protein